MSDCPFPSVPELRAALTAYLAIRKIGLRPAARELGVSKDVLWRTIHGGELDAINYIAIAKKIWPPANYLLTRCRDNATLYASKRRKPCH